MKKIARTLCLIWLGIFGCAGILLFTGCSWKQEKPEKINLAFTVVDEARLPAGGAGALGAMLLRRDNRVWR